MAHIWSSVSDLWSPGQLIIPTSKLQASTLASTPKTVTSVLQASRVVDIMAVRAAITVSVTSVLLGASRHTLWFMPTHSSSRMLYSYRSTLYPLDCGLTYPLEDTRHRRPPLGRSPILPCAHEGCARHWLRCCRCGYARRRDDSLESGRRRGG